MTTKEQFIIELLKEGREWFTAILTFLLGWHIKQPSWIKGKNDNGS